MKALGITRKIDELGRVVLPIEVRRSLGINPKTLVSIELVDVDIIIGVAPVGYKGMTRPVDDLGRVVIPIEMRRELDLQEKDALSFFMSGSDIHLRPYRISCTFCGETDNLQHFKHKAVCPSCLEGLKKL